MADSSSHLLSTATVVTVNSILPVILRKQHENELELLYGVVGIDSTLILSKEHYWYYGHVLYTCLQDLIDYLSLTLTPYLLNVFPSTDG